MVRCCRRSPSGHPRQGQEHGQHECKDKEREQAVNAEDIQVDQRTHKGCCYRHRRSSQRRRYRARRRRRRSCQRRRRQRGACRSRTGGHTRVRTRRCQRRH
ncbi:protamine-2 [Felis catus]|uniref:protamine-2 n=1 Tax=Felis catus TaxID=9685 RepID=UPI001D199BD7|nr:protamine-2 [Felis catus]